MTSLIFFKQFTHCRTLADHPVDAGVLGELAVQSRDFGRHGLCFQRQCDPMLQFTEVDRLRKEVDRALFERFDGGLHTARPGDHDERGVRCLLLGPAQQFHAIGVRHPQIGDDDRHAVVNVLERFVAVLDDNRLPPLKFDPFAQRFTTGLIVIDEQNAGRILGHHDQTPFRRRPTAANDGNGTSNDAVQRTQAGRADSLWPADVVGQFGRPRRQIAQRSNLRATRGGCCIAPKWLHGRGL